MINLKYKVEFFDQWHTGSGLSAGADVDALVIKDKDDLPFIPGKTIKGLLRHALEEIIEFKGIMDEKKEEIAKNFGLLKKIEPTNEEEEEVFESERGEMFCTNATLSNEISQTIKKDNLQPYLYRSVASTSIDNAGVAKKHSLRRIETTVPVTLYGEIFGVSANLEKDIEDALSYIKRVGVNRNRGLGRCKFSIIKREENKS